MRIKISPTHNDNSCLMQTSQVEVCFCRNLTPGNFIDGLIRHLAIENALMLFYSLDGNSIH